LLEVTGRCVTPAQGYRAKSLDVDLVSDGSNFECKNGSLIKKKERNKSEKYPALKLILNAETRAG
jgi:hypothetical protein